MARRATELDLAMTRNRDCRSKIRNHGLQQILTLESDCQMSDCSRTHRKLPVQLTSSAICLSCSLSMMSRLHAVSVPFVFLLSSEIFKWYAYATSYLAGCNYDGLTQDISCTLELGAKT